MKLLTLFRHGKSSRKDPELDDRERPLTGRGKRDAPEMGRRLLAHGGPPDAILSSPAKRALSTARLVAKELGYPRENILVVEDLYDASPGKIREIVNALDNRWSDVILVGHNPGLMELAQELSPSAIDQFPTSAFARIRFNSGNWSSIWKSRRELAAFDYPKSGSGEKA